MPTEDKDEMEEMVSGVEGIYLREPSEEEAQERESQQEEPQVTPEGEWTSEALEGLSQYVQHDNAVQTWTNYFDVIGGPTSLDVSEENTHEDTTSQVSVPNTLV